MPENIPVAEESADLLHASTRGLRRQFMRDLGADGITPGQWRALRTVAWCEAPIRMSDLADRLHIARRSATTVVDELVEEGLLVRGSDPADRRSVVVSATAAGHDLLHELRARRRRAAAGRLGELDEREMTVLRDLLRRVVGDPDGG